MCVWECESGRVGEWASEQVWLRNLSFIVMEFCFIWVICKNCLCQYMYCEYLLRIYNASAFFS